MQAPTAPQNAPQQNQQPAQVQPVQNSSTAQPIQNSSTAQPQQAQQGQANGQQHT